MKIKRCFFPSAALNDDCSEFFFDYYKLVGKSLLFGAKNLFGKYKFFRE